MYDYLIVGAGLFGAVFAREMTDRGKRCLVIEKRGHIAGNIYSKEIEGIQVHQYGPHIFHTDSKRVWQYINRFSEFNHFIYSPIANYKGELYNLPFNMNTFVKLWGITTPEEAQEKIQAERERIRITEPKNLEEQAISFVGVEIYEKFIKGYTEKQWGRSCKELPSSIIQRLPVRYTFDNNYFNHPYQGIPIGGYTKLIEKMLEGISVEVETDFLSNKEYYTRLAKWILYTGTIDHYFQYCYGELEYRSLRFEQEILDIPNFQGVAGMNYTDKNTPYTRIVEHKHFEFGKGNAKKTVITKEYPKRWEKGDEPYYPVNDKKNQMLYQNYRALAKQEPNIIFGGRLGLYQYLDMDKVVIKALECVENLEKKEQERG
ncbi:MAG: UDP-galactopyranose mutase [Lachnospiraceae bacterium]|jgi:UDP-galactopyranose mutase|nr:UDP-galactopyranose mutase [Lachnospiraceae bacterium]MCX4315133.1 UDP-galactopyranose mutase [Lachnospiraceae bacterium]